MLIAAGVAAGVPPGNSGPRPKPFASISVAQITNTGTLDKIALSP